MPPRCLLRLAALALGGSGALLGAEAARVVDEVTYGNSHNDSISSVVVASAASFLDGDLGHTTEEAAAKAAQAALVGRNLGAYRLERQLRVVRLRDSSAVAGKPEVRAPVVPFREKIRPDWRLGTFLGKGSFGATYLATQLGANGKPMSTVAVKFLYKMNQHNKIMLVTGEDTSSKHHLAELRQECGKLQALQQAATKNHKGAHRVIRCLKCCMFPSMSCPTGKGDAQFIVMNYAGEEGLKWYRQHRRDENAVATVLEHVREGIVYLSRDCNPAWIHHDLKWQNIAVKAFQGQWTGTIIDFGAAVQAEPRNVKAKVPSTPGFAAPEWIPGKRAFLPTAPAHAFDVYSLGVMALEGMCGLDPKIMVEYGNFARPRIGDIRVVALSHHVRVCSACCDQLAGLVQPSPFRRLRPDDFVFTRGGLRPVTAIRR